MRFGPVPAFPRAPFAGFSSAGETQRPENQTAPVTDGVGKDSVPFEQLAALLNAQAHGASHWTAVAIKIAKDSTMRSFRQQVWAGTTPKTFLGAQAKKKWGRSSPSRAQAAPKTDSAPYRTFSILSDLPNRLGEREGD